MFDEVNHEPDSSHICIGCSNLFDAAIMPPAIVADKSDVEVVASAATQDESLVFDFSVLLTFQTMPKGSPVPLRLSQVSII